MRADWLYLPHSVLVAALAICLWSAPQAARGAAAASAVATETATEATDAAEGDSPSADGGLDPDDLPAVMDLSLEELLNDPAGVAPNVAAERCMNRFSGYSTEILDSQHLLFKSSTGRRAWLNRLPHDCIGLRPSMALVFESQSARRCAQDTVYGFNPSIGPALSARSARCRLGKFEPITLEHAQALEDTFARHAKALAEDRRQERKAKRAERKRKRSEAREARRKKRAEANS